MGTDQQLDSPAQQRQDIEALAQQQGFRIIRWNEDHGQTGTESSKRRAFQKLLGDPKAGTFLSLLLSEQSPMSREHIFDAMPHSLLFRDAGVSIITCQRGELKFDNLGGVITAIVDQDGTREESLKLADRVVSGKRLAVSRGQKQGGTLLGYDPEVPDKVAQVSLLEAYLTASARVGEFYRSRSRLATEHPLIDDNGDRLGTPADWFRGLRATRRANDRSPVDCPTDHQFHLIPGPPERALSEKARQTRDQLEQEIERLRALKETIEEHEYYARLEILLLQLARLYESIDPTPSPTLSPGTLPEAGKLDDKVRANKHMLNEPIHIGIGSISPRSAAIHRNLTVPHHPIDLQPIPGHTNIRVS